MVNLMLCEFYLSEKKNLVLSARDSRDRMFYTLQPFIAT